MFVLLGLNFVRVGVESFRVETTLGQLGREVLGLQDQKKQLESERELRASDAYVEEIARDKLNLVKQGETLVVVDQRPAVNKKEGDWVNSFKQQQIYQQWLQIFREGLP